MCWQKVSLHLKIIKFKKLTKEREIVSWYKSSYGIVNFASNFSSNSRH